MFTVSAAVALVTMLVLLGALRRTGHTSVAPDLRSRSAPEAPSHHPCYKHEMRNQHRPALLAAALGALWGLAGYALLWGYTPLLVQRPFVVSVAGTLVFAPVRIVLLGIRLVEENLASGPFDFSGNNGWIGALAGLVGALLFLGAYALARVAVAAMRRRVRPRRPTGLLR
jgi:membrane associated rhomboid family serine protease